MSARAARWLTALAWLAAGCAPEPGALGLLLPLSGPDGLAGIELRQGVELALAELPAEARPRFLSLDTETTSSALEQLADAGAHLVLGPLRGEQARALRSRAEAHRMVLLTPAADPGSTGAGLGFGLRPQAAVTAGALASFARDELRLDNVGLILDLARRPAVEQARAFRQAFCRSLGRVGAAYTFYGGDADVATILQRALAQGGEQVQGWLLAGEPEDLVRMIQGASAASLSRIVLLGAHGWDSQELARAVAGRARGAYRAGPFCAQEPRPVVQRFVAAYQQRHQEAPSARAALGYDAARVALSVFDPALGGGDLADRLRTLRRFDGVTGNIDIDRSGRAVGTGVVLEQLHDSEAERFLKRVDA